VAETVTFTVQNVNRSAVPCGVDGLTYQIQGELVGPASELQSGSVNPAVVVYLHGLGLGQWMWTFDAVPTYDFARDMAALGRVSLVIDRLGYGASGHPEGFNSCIGGQADVAHQLVQDLRSGSYRVVGGGIASRFSRVALMGFSAAGAITELEAYSFRDIDAVGVLSYADGDLTPLTQTTLGQTVTSCNAGGQPSGGPDSPGGYAAFGQTSQAFGALMFFSATPPVVRAATPLRNLDPCGDVESIGATIQSDLGPTGISIISVPVLLVHGSNDAIFLPQAGTDQRARFTGSNDVTLVSLPATGHLLTLELTAGAFRTTLANWLTGRGF
jgi:pimeloyl-ACP methyl ester carboxylesterase